MRRVALSSETGSVMILALLTIMVMILITAGVVITTTHETLSTQVALDGVRAMAIAEAGMARAIASLRRDADWTGSGVALGRCGSYAGQPVLYDLLSSQCIGPNTNADGVLYPMSGPVALSTPAPGAASGQCEAPKFGMASPGPLSGVGPVSGRFIATYEVIGPAEISVRVYGRTGRAARAVAFRARRVSAADFVAYSASGVDTMASGNGTFTINGSIYIRGDWSFKGQSRQLNNRPVVAGDTAPFDNQTFICGDINMTGNPQIGTPSQKMAAIHISGTAVSGADTSCSEYSGLCTRLLDNIVPDIRLADIGARVAAVKAADSYTNDLTGGASLPHLSVLERSGSAWPPQASRKDLEFGATSWRLPKKGRVAQCQTASPTNADLAAVLTDCSALFDATTATLYVGAGQTIYVPGAMRTTVDVSYRVDNDPAASRVAGDASTIVAACEAGNSCDPNNASPHAAVEMSGHFRSQLPASGAGASYPSHDMLAVVANGRVRTDLPGAAASAELNLAIAAGCAAALPTGRCTTTLERNLQLYGSLMSRQLVFKQNVDFYQVPDFVVSLPSTAMSLLVDPEGTSVIVRNWREIGF